MFDIYRERIYRCSATELWRAIATREGLSAWLMPCDFEPTLGHEFTFRTKPVPGFDGIVHAKVLELVEPKLLRLSWKTGSVNTELSLNIEAIDEEHVRLRLKHSGFNRLSNVIARIALGFGWTKLLRTRLSDWIECAQGAST